MPRMITGFFPYIYSHKLLLYLQHNRWRCKDYYYHLMAQLDQRNGTKYLSRDWNPRQAVELHRTGTFEGSSTDWATELQQDDNRINRFRERNIISIDPTAWSNLEQQFEGGLVALDGHSFKQREFPKKLLDDYIFFCPESVAPTPTATIRTPTTPTTPTLTLIFVQRKNRFRNFRWVLLSQNTLHWLNCLMIRETRYLLKMFNPESIWFFIIPTTPRAIVPGFLQPCSWLFNRNDKATNEKCKQISLVRLMLFILPVQ